ncbi:MAG: aldehyde dehydrogenase family protein, partial [Terriglobus roseus]|nr:aldehyde dehydrogenase family protein [Terriglobus roseus]
MSANNPTKVALRRLHATSKQLQAAAAIAPQGKHTTHEAPATTWETTNFLDNEFVASATRQWIDLHDPATNNVVTRVPQSTDAELAAAVDSAERAFKGWRATSLLHRQQLMFKFVALIRENWD